MRYGTYDEIRAALALRLGHRPKEEIWDRLVGGRLWGVKYGRKLPRLTISKSRCAVNSNVSHKPLPSTAKRVLLILASVSLDFRYSHDLTARQAATEKSVITFRRQHLTEGLLKREQVDEWISEVKLGRRNWLPATSESPFPTIVSLSDVTDATLTEPLLTISDTTAGTQVDVELLSYALPDRISGSDGIP